MSSLRDFLSRDTFHGAEARLERELYSLAPCSARRRLSQTAKDGSATHPVGMTGSGRISGGMVDALYSERVDRQGTPAPGPLSPHVEAVSRLEAARNQRLPTARYPHRPGVGSRGVTRSVDVAYAPLRNTMASTGNSGEHDVVDPSDDVPVQGTDSAFGSSAVDVSRQARPGPSSTQLTSGGHSGRPATQRNPSPAPRRHEGVVHMKELVGADRFAVPATPAKQEVISDLVPSASQTALLIPVRSRSATPAARPPADNTMPMACGAALHEGQQQQNHQQQPVGLVARFRRPRSAPRVGVARLMQAGIVSQPSGVALRAVRVRGRPSRTPLSSMQSPWAVMPAVPSNVHSYGLPAPPCSSR